MIFRTHKNTLKCYGHIWSGDGVSFMSAFEELEANYNDIEIRLHTYGGSVIDGNLMFNAINKSKSKVTIVVEGLAASMGSVLLVSTPYVKIVENGYIMVHAPSGGGPGTAKDLSNFAKLLNAIEINFIEKLAKRTGKTNKEAAKLMDGDNWIDAKEALQMGLVNEVIPAVTDTPLTIKEPQDLGELEVFNAYATLMINPAEHPKTKTNMKQLLITALALSAVNTESSDTAVIEAVKAEINGLKTKLSDAETAKVEAENKLNTYKEEQVNNIVNAYAKANNLSDEKKQVYAKIGKTSGVEALQEILGDPKANGQAPNISGMIQNQSPNTGARADWDWDKYQKEDPRALEQMAEDNPEAYTALFNKKYQK